MKGTHSQIIIGKNFSYFADGIPNDHECNNKGDIMYWTASGKFVTWYTIKKWAHLTTEAREPLLYKHFDSIGDPICSSSVSCSICKQSVISQSVWI